MNSKRLVESVAYFFKPQREPVVSEALVHSIVELSNSLGARPLLFTALGAGFELDDCCAFSDDTAGLELWENPIPNRKTELLDALRRNTILGIGFDVPLPTARCRSEWSFYFYPGLGRVYCGALATEMTKASLLLRTYEIASRFFDVRYGFAYCMPLGDEPDCYAHGSPRTSLADLRQWLATRSTESRVPATDDECWRRELEGPRRHLEGLFRDAYPLNVVSSAHVRRAALESAGIGLLKKLDESHWLWEIDEEHLSDASDYLARGQSLVRQQYI